MEWIVIPLVVGILLMTVGFARPRLRHPTIVRDAPLRQAMRPPRPAPPLMPRIIPVAQPTARPRSPAAAPQRAVATAASEPQALSPAAPPPDDPWEYDPPAPTPARPGIRQARPDEFKPAGKARGIHEEPSDWWRTRESAPVEDEDAPLVPNPGFPHGGTYHPEGWTWARQREEERSDKREPAAED